MRRGRLSIMPPAVVTCDGSYVQTRDSASPCAGCDPASVTMSDVLLRGKRLVARVVLLQSICALPVALLYFVFEDPRAGLAALAGGLIVAAGSALFGWRMFKPGIAAGATLTTAMYAAVALKWLWFMLALYLAIARLKLEAAPLLIGMAAGFAGYWLALGRLGRRK